mgnify:CR=1 FL=1
MRTIDADALKKAIPETSVDAFQNCRNCVLLDKEQVNELIDAAPTVEIDRPTRSQFKRMAAQLGYEKVIHCRECGHYDPDTEFCEIHSHFITRDGKFCYPSESSEWKMFSPDYFCGNGERRKDEQ